MGGIGRFGFFVLLVLMMPAGLCGAASAIDPPGLLVVTDPPWDQEPDDHNTFDTTDLTQLRIFNTADEIHIEIPFQSSWSGLILHVLIEARFDAAGADGDPFWQPVNYGHDLRPDYALTCKYSSHDYGDFRRWNNGYWEWYDLGSQTYSSMPGDEPNICGIWTTKGVETFSIRVPWAPFGAAPDSLLFEAYLTQDEDGIKRSAFDSVPSDNTLDLDFDYFDPQPGDWDTALGPVTLSAWSPVYRICTEFSVAPEIVSVVATPDTVVQGEPFLLAVEVVDSGGGIGSVVADLSSMGGSVEEFLYDDGDPAHGDPVAGDGIYHLIVGVPESWGPGEYLLEVAAYNSSHDAWDLATAAVRIAWGAPIVGADDAVGDDHGPNQPGEIGLYYVYPTNPFFVQGAFDLTRFEIHRVMVSGDQGGEEKIAFVVGMVHFPDPSDPAHADWNPSFGDLNLEKIDILIDSAPGGATASLPNRNAAYQPWEAWEYALIVDGWFKAVVPSLGSNVLDDWRAQALTADSDIQLVSDFAANSIVAYVDPAALGHPSDEDLRTWDYCIQMAGRDFGGEEVLGGIRWVNDIVSEWQFGGGSFYTYDANLIDLLLVPGQYKPRGRPQEYLLDYTTDEAVDRRYAGLTAVAIEMAPDGATGIPVDVVEAAGLAQNAPNPFNPLTTIAFEMPASETVRLAVFDLAGRRVRVLIADEVRAAGAQRVVWDGTDDDGCEVASGVYFYRLVAGEFDKTKRMVLVR